LPRNKELLAHPGLNKDAAFSADERAALGLQGLLPWRVLTMDEQVTLELEHLRRKSDDVERYIGLNALQNRNETLFYRLLIDHLEELAPIIYTPTVGHVCREFSHVVRRMRGCWVTPDDIDRIPELLQNAATPGVRLIVATDNERILGLGDQGAGGMGIPIGKLALYTAGSGIHPRLTLAVSLDCGTDNQGLLADPLYLGYRAPRLRGAAYDALIEAFVQAITEVFPDALLQWEDFKQHNALRLLDRYRERLPSFNDDIQGTAAVVVAGILAALRLRGERISSQRLVFLGAGAASLGIARLVHAAMAAEGARAEELAHSVAMLDSQGLVFSGRAQVDPDKARFALTRETLSHYGFETSASATSLAAAYFGLDDVVRHVAPTILIGTSGVAGAFTEAAVRQMAASTPVPLVFPLSNPTANCEATPADVFKWTEGRALVATGSPFGPIDSLGRARLVGQANNMFVFPGIGLGAMAARARRIPDEVFLMAARTLAALVPDHRLEQGALYPALSDLRPISRAIAVAVARELCAQGLGEVPGGSDNDAGIEEAVAAIMWAPDYTSYC
jgi:malic enzyme